LPLAHLLPSILQHRLGVISLSLPPSCYAQYTLFMKYANTEPCNEHPHRLEKHLSLLHRQELIEAYNDRHIAPAYRYSSEDGDHSR